MSETETVQDEEERMGEDDYLLNISVEVGQHVEGQNMGIGVATQNNWNKKCEA